MKSLQLTCSRIKTRNLFAVFFLLLVGFAGLHAQTNTGAVRGEVKDAQGGSIPKAQVTLTNLDTKVARTDVTNSAGTYLFGQVDPGTYKVTIAMPGFKTYDTTNNVVSLGGVTTVDATLQIGATNETIEVTADTLTLNTANVSGGQLYDEKQLQTLPNLGRNPFIFATLDANVVTLGNPVYVRAEDSTGSSQISLAGAPSGTNSYNVDGIPVSSSSGGETFIVSPEAVSNAKIQADTFDAEIGRTGGGVFNASLKSGSAQYHGVLYGETRRTGLAANAWFNPNNTPTSNDTTYLYAGAFGGPVPFSQKNRWTKDTFFWVTEEGYRQAQPNTPGGTSSYYVPTVAERAGDFSAYAPANGSTTSCTGTTGAAGGACYIIYDPTAFPRKSFLQETGKNIIPNNATYINPIGQYAASLFAPPSNSNIYGGALNYTIPIITIKTRSDEYIGKLEHTFFPWWTSSVSYLHEAIQEPDVCNILSPYANCSANGLNIDLKRYYDATSLYNSFTINPTTLLTVGYGFNRYFSASYPYSIGFNNATGFGGTGFPANFTANTVSKTLPQFTLSNVNNAPSEGGSFAGPSVQASHNFVAILSKTIGKNDLRFGYTFRAFTYYTNPQTGSAGAFTFTGQNSNSTGTSSSSNGPTAIADLLLGAPASASLQVNAGPFFNRETYNSLFVQDDLRLTPKITVNLGLRYEYELGQYEAANKFNVGFSPTVASSYVNSTGATENLSGGLLFAGVAGAPTHCCNNGHTKFSPRIGVAYQVMPNTVIHAGYGFFFAPVGIATTANQGYTQVTNYAPGNTTAAIGVGATGAYLANPFPGGVLPASGNSLGALTGIGSSVGTVQDFKRGYPLVQQYMLDVERQLPHDIIVKLSYIGSHGTNFPLTVNINQIPDSVLASANASGTNLSTKITNPLYTTNKFNGTYAPTGILTNTTYAQGQFQMPFPQYTAVNVAKSAGFSWYNSLAVKAEKRVTNGLTILGTYTWASNWDNIYGTGSQVFSTYGPQDNTNLGAEYARSINSIPNRFTVASTYDLPVGRGKRFLGYPSGFAGKTLDYAVGGWQVNYEQVIQNGVPLSVYQTDLSTSSYGTTGYGGAYQRPTLVGDPHNACVGGSPQTRLGYVAGRGSATPYINAAAFTATQPYLFGNTSRSLPCRAPGSNTATASVNKSFSITEKVKVQFRMEALNLWNTPQFGYPTTALTVSGNGINAAPTVAQNTTTNPTAQAFGNLATQIGFPRIIQFGGRLTF